jgi:integrase/recombinase XerC
LGPDRTIAAKRSKAPAGRAISPVNLGSDPNFAPLAPISGASSTVDELVTRYLNHCRVEKRLAARTVELYTLDLQKLAEFADKAKIDLLQVQPTHIRQWAARMHAGGRSPRGIALILSGWRGFYAWLGRESRVSLNPVTDVRAPKAPKPLPKALSVDDAVQLASFKSASHSPWLEARDAAIVELLYGSGLRVGELTGLDVAASKNARGWLDLQGAEAHVLGKGAKHRSVPMGVKSVEAVRAWLAVRAQGPRGAGAATVQTHTLVYSSHQVRNNPAVDVQSNVKADLDTGVKADVKADVTVALFIGQNGTRLTAQSIWLRLRSRSQHAGLPMPVHPHMLRHSFASHVLQSSSDLRAVQELLGHANISTTQVYTRLDFQHLAKTYDAAHPRAKLKK